jgi:hypothetical protein
MTYLKTATMFSAAALAMAVAGCGGSGNQHSNAQAYVKATQRDVAVVQSDEVKVGLDILKNDATSLASDAQTAHDDYNNAKSDIILAGSNVADNSQLGDAENQVDDGINELKNAMGSVVAFSENPNDGTLGVANAKLTQGINDWDQGVITIWALARVSDPPLLNGSSGNSASTTQTTTTARPANTTPATGSFHPGDQNPGDAHAADCPGMEIGPHSDCSVARQVAGDLSSGKVSGASFSDTVTDNANYPGAHLGDTITFFCSVSGNAPYRCASDHDHSDWFEFQAPTTTAHASASTSTAACPNGTIGIGQSTAPASHEVASGVTCQTVAGILRTAWVWRWGVLMWGGVPGETPGNTSPSGWSCNETYEYFGTANQTGWDDGSLSGSVTSCTHGGARFVVTMGRVTPWGHSI